MAQPRWTDPLDERFWQDVAARANATEAVRSISSHLAGTRVRLVAGDDRRTLAFDRGQVAVEDAGADAGVDIVIEAATADWLRLLGGDVHYYHAINPYFGFVRMQADGLTAGWTLPTLSTLFRLAALVWTGRPDVSGEFV